ncbi:MAG: helical backbone metal receptor [Acidimicrobiales bacterium]
MTPRVVSLVPSATETLISLGVVPVGVTRWCEHPELAQVGGTKDPDVAAIARLAPEVVIVDREENRQEDADALSAAGIEVLVLHVTAVRDVDPEIAKLARRLGVAERWSPPDLERAPRQRRRAFIPIWRERGADHGPHEYMTLSAATYGSSVLDAIGVDNVFSDAVQAYPQTTLAEVAVRDVDLVIAPSEPYPFGERHRRELEEVAPTVFVDGQDLFWWGTRTSGALERLDAALNRS